ncbi:MAG TPA: hypothetical protein VN701_00290 [Candidatus Paceibacterota bacterium]|nr:hypothetical protein [Candidatus Paceibacterota bacterium]
MKKNYKKYIFLFAGAFIVIGIAFGAIFYLSFPSLHGIIQIQTALNNAYPSDEFSLKQTTSFGANNIQVTTLFIALVNSASSSNSKLKAIARTACDELKRDDIWVDLVAVEPVESHNFGILQYSVDKNGISGSCGTF